MKRALDITVAGLSLLVLSPLLAASAAAIALWLGRPILFKQARAGLRGARFVLVKFRTMSAERGLDGNLLPDEIRLNRLGRFLRSASIDELPQFWNVLRGEMSLVGPRPLLPEYVTLYTPEQRRRLEVKPGITGWAAVNGRNAQSWESIFRQDVWYVDHRTMILDLKILWLTAVTVLSGRGIERGDANSDSAFAAAVRAGRTNAQRQPLES